VFAALPPGVAVIAPPAAGQVAEFVNELPVR